MSEKIKLDIRELQRSLNKLHIYDYENKELIVSGIIAKRTRSAFNKLKGVEI